MINLETLARTFVGSAIEVTKANVKKKMDDFALQAVHNQNYSNRGNALRKWLEDYAALMGFSEEDRSKVVSGILNFADTNGCHHDTLLYDNLIDKFTQLHAICGASVSLTMKKKQRNLISLTSKGLWCCYPNGVPIYDSLVQNVLWILCKLAKLQPKVNTKEYPAFADVWFQIYKQVGPIIAEATDQINYPYKVRVFDRMLWVIGQHDYVANVSKIRRLN